MAIEVDLSNPPPWVVHVHFLEDGREIPVTWPFPDEETARAAYALAVSSGQFERCVRKATKKQPAIMINMASLWRMMQDTDEDGKVHIWYRGVFVKEEGESKGNGNTNQD